MTRSVIRRVDWTCHREEAPEAPEITHEFECTSCGDTGPCSEDFETARGWTFEHIGRNPSHTGYREILHRFWRMSMTS
ncbi:DUF7848 domain-containing protein [Streptomyces olivochromogenes]|uniref:DUF7848 domain-containing protein n=1 Tax=Streptomyces olivochromogenes TaxID=1963 RepID=UPI003681C97E